MDYKDETMWLMLGDCLELMRDLPDGSVDSIITDPPYELGFMGKGWDKSGIANSVEMWSEALRVLKPGGHLLAFSGSRTYHRMVCAIEDAGFEVRDQIMWLYGSGFPKSHDVSKAIDKAAGAEREPGVPGRYAARRPRAEVKAVSAYQDGVGNASTALITDPATDAARQWNGWGTALKPAHEPIVVARKPLIGTVAANVLAHGTGALNIDGCRVATDENLNGGAYCDGNKRAEDASSYVTGTNAGEFVQPSGRWPANICHDGSPEVLAAFPTHGNQTEARFFYCAKASKKDRNEGCEQIDAKQYSHDGRQTPIENAYQRNASRASNNHPTVKPTDLMRYLVRLITPPGGTVLDPFMGSGSTGKAAMIEGFRFIGIDMTPEYIEIARARIAAAVPANDNRPSDAQRQENLF